MTNQAHPVLPGRCRDHTAVVGPSGEHGALPADDASLAAPH